LNLERFLIYSFFLHALLVAALVTVVSPDNRQAGSRTFETVLVSPEEVFKGLQREAPPVRVPNPPSISRSSPRQSTRQPSIGRYIPEASNTAPPFSGSPEERPGKSESDGRGGHAKPEQQTIPQHGMREKLFDRGVIGDVAKRNVDREARERTFTFDTKEFRYLVYNRRLKERIESIWVYPRDAAARGIYGDLVIRFTILRNGELGAVELVRTSGYKSLDDAAIKALYDGAPYWPLPKEWGLDAYTIEGFFIYTLYGYYIM